MSLFNQKWWWSAAADLFSPFYSWFIMGHARNQTWLLSSALSTELGGVRQEIGPEHVQSQMGKVCRHKWVFPLIIVDSWWDRPEIKPRPLGEHTSALATELHRVRQEIGLEIPRWPNFLEKLWLLPKFFFFVICLANW